MNLARFDAENVAGEIKGANLTATVLGCQRVTIVPVGPDGEVLDTWAITGPIPDEERQQWQGGWPRQRQMQDYLPPEIIARLHLGAVFRQQYPAVEPRVRQPIGDEQGLDRRRQPQLGEGRQQQ